MDKWVNRLDIINRESLIAGLKEIFHIPQEVEDLRILRSHLVAKMQETSKSDMVKITGILLKLDDLLIGDLQTKLIAAEELSQKQRILSDFKKFIENSEQNQNLKIHFERIEFGWFEFLVHLVKERLPGRISTVIHERLTEFFRSAEQNGIILSRKMLIDIAQEIKEQLPLSFMATSSKKPRMRESHQHPHPVKISKRSFLSSPEIVVPKNAALDPYEYLSDAYVLHIPFDGIWQIMGNITFEFIPNTESSCDKKGTVTAEKTVYPSKTKQTCPSFTVSKRFVLGKGDKVTLRALIPCPPQEPIKFSSARLAAVLLREYHNPSF